MRTTATMMFGCGETIEQRMNHFDIVRQIQEETGGFTAFIPWTFQRENTSLGRFVKEEATAVEYLQDAGDLAHLSRQHSRTSSRPG